MKKVIILNYQQQCSRDIDIDIDKTVDNAVVYFRNVRRESLFTQVKEPGTRLIITFYQLCSECENIIFDVMC